MILLLNTHINNQIYALINMSITATSQIELSKHLQQLLRKYSKTYSFSSNDHKITSDICNSVIKTLKNNVTLTNSFFDDILHKYLSYQKYRYSSSTPLKVYRADILKFFKSILPSWDISENNILYILKTDEYFTPLLCIISSKPEFNGYSSSFVEEIVNCGIIYSINDMSSLDSLFKNQKFDFSKNDCYFRCRNDRFNSNLAKVIEKSDHKFTQNNLIDICEILPHTAPLLEVMIKKGYVLDDKCLSRVCSHGTPEGLKYILQYKFIINKEHFRTVIQSGSKKRTRNNRSLEIGKKVSYLLENNYIIDEDDIMYAIENKVIIPELEKYTSVKVTFNMMKTAWSNNFYPNYEVTYPDDASLLYKYCICDKSVPMTRKFLKNNKIIPNIGILEELCKHKSYKQLVRLLIAHNDNVSAKCIENAINTFCNNSSYIPILFPKYKASVNKKISELEQEIADLKKKLEESEKGNCKDIKTDKSIKKDNKNIKKDNHVKEFNILSIDTSGINLRLKNRKYKVPPKYAEYANIGKNRRLSFLDIKKNIVKDITDNNMFYKDNKNIIDLSDKLRKTLNIGDGYIKISDLDSIITLFYKD